MSLMRGRLFAGALFAGVLFGQQTATDTAAAQNSGGADAYYNRRLELIEEQQAKRKANSIAIQNSQVTTIVQTLIVSGILEQLSTKDLTIKWQT